MQLCIAANETLTVVADLPPPLRPVVPAWVAAHVAAAGTALRVEAGGATGSGSGGSAESTSQVTVTGRKVDVDNMLLAFERDFAGWDGTSRSLSLSLSPPLSLSIPMWMYTQRSRF